MQFLKFIPIVQVIILLIAFYRAYKSNEKVYSVLEIRGFWGLAILSNLPGIIRTIGLYQGVTSGQYDWGTDEKWPTIIIFAMQCLLILLEASAIYLLSTEEKKFAAAFYWTISVSVVILMLVFRVWLLNEYLKTHVLLLAEANLAPVAVSLYAYWTKVVKTKEMGYTENIITRRKD